MYVSIQQHEAQQINYKIIAKNGIRHGQPWIETNDERRELSIFKQMKEKNVKFLAIVNGKKDRLRPCQRSTLQG